MQHERVDSISHLIEDLRQQYPRLVLLVGEQHDSAETRKLFSHLAKNADVGFFEIPNETRTPTGQPITPEYLAQRRTIRTPDAASHAANQAYCDMLAHMPAAFRVDMPRRTRGHFAAAMEADKRLHADGVPHTDPVRKAVQDIVIDRSITRLEDSNPFMANCIANHLDANYSENKPFFAVALVGSAHLTATSHYGLSGTPADLGHYLRQRGYHSVAIDITPHPRLNPRNKPGDHFIIPEYIKDNVDFSIEVIDPACRHARNRSI